MRLRQTSLSFAAFATLSVPVLAGCSAGHASLPAIDQSKVPSESVALHDAPDAGSVINSTRELGLAILKETPTETLVVSPASAVIALSMLGSGAQGETEQQLEQVLGAGGTERDRAVNALSGSLDPYRDDVSKLNPKKLPAEPQVHLANQVVLDDQLQIEQSYLDSLKQWFDAGVLHTDLGSAEGKKQLDKWVRYNTAGLIKESAVQPDPMLRLVLQNAVLFAAKWTVPFDAGSSYEQDFTKEDGSTVNAQFMHDHRGTQYSEINGWKMIEMPYGTDQNLVARMVLPPEGVKISDVDSSILDKLEKGLDQQDVIIAIPKLDLKSSSDLIPTLKGLGLTTVFKSTHPSSLAYISTAEDLFVSGVVQQGRIIMDEDGTVAAAVTEISVMAGSAPAKVEPPKEFIADRPFLIILQDKTVGWDLFQVMVNDPTTKTD